MAEERTIVVAIEDYATAGAVAAEAVRLAIAEQATSLVLIHVLDDHPVVNSILVGFNYSTPEPVVEPEPEGKRLLDTAAQVMRSEFEALGVPVPAISQELPSGHAGELLAQAVVAHNAGWIVLGARRPHLFGWLTHPDVKAHLAGRAACRVQVAPLQERGAAATG